MDLSEALMQVDRLEQILAGRRARVSKQLSYMRGESGVLRFASEKFRDHYEDQYKDFSDNWCAPVASAPAERMTLLGIRPHGAEKGIDDELQRIWYATDSDAESSEAFLVFSAASRAYTLVHPAESGPDGEPGLTWEHPETAIVDTHPVTRQDRFGLVVWRDGDQELATLYTPDQIWRFVRDADQLQDGSMPSAQHGGWRLLAHPSVPLNPAPNPLGEVPLTEMRNQTLLDDQPISDIAGVMALQDAVNLVWAYLMNALDMASLPARVVTGADTPKIPILDENGQVIGHEDVELDELQKERILWVPSSAAKIAEWSAAQLEPFGHVIERIVQHIAAQTRTPPHYLLANMVNTAAESLSIAEAGLVSKTKERARYVSRGLRKTMRLLAKAKGADEKRLYAISAGKLIWENIQYRSESQLADAMTKLRSAGFPLEYCIERIAEDPAEVQRILHMVEKERWQDPLAAGMRGFQTAVEVPAGEVAL